MKIGDEFEAIEGAAALLLCARCKEPVKGGEPHECKKEKENANSNSNEKDQKIGSV